MPEDQTLLDQRAKRIYESLVARGHGPRGTRASNAPPWEQLPQFTKDDYRQAAADLANADGGQETMAL